MSALAPTAMPCAKSAKGHTHTSTNTEENLVCMDTLVPISTIAPMSVFMQKVPISQQKQTHTVNNVIQREQEGESIALRMHCEVVFRSLPSNVCHDLFQ